MVDRVMKDFYGQRPDEYEQERFPDYAEEIARRGPQQEPIEGGRLPTLQERAKANVIPEYALRSMDALRDKAERGKTQPWYGDGYRPEAGSVAHEWLGNLLFALGAVRGGAGLHANPRTTPSPLELPGYAAHEQPLYITGKIPQTLLSTLGPYADKRREADVPMASPPMPEKRPYVPDSVALSGPAEDGRVVRMPEGAPHEPSLLSQIMPQAMRDRVDLDHLAENPWHHAKHAVDPLVATWGLGVPGAETASILNMLQRLYGRAAPGLGTATVEALPSASLPYGTGRPRP